MPSVSSYSRRDSLGSAAIGPNPAMNRTFMALVLARGLACAHRSSAAHRAGDLPLRLALRDGFSLVVLALAARQADLDLDVVARDVEAQRNHRVALLPQLADEARDLPLVQQQLARPDRLLVHDVALRV